ncbi:MAG: preprotein translocase subunit SecG [Bryobacterales bacterium]|jgi:preprotein translocase subunit SecG|nr:preprotein translocase subunit SecG [Bryobacterales bacterium]
MFTLLTIVHVIVCLFLIVVVLLQSGKAADLASAFGGMGSQTAFGPRGAATLLSKATTISAVLFMVTSLSLSIMATRDRGQSGQTSVIESLEGGSTAGGTQTTLPSPVPGATPAPSVTLTDETTGVERTFPLDIPPPPGAAPQEDATKAPAKK